MLLMKDENRTKNVAGGMQASRPGGLALVVISQAAFFFMASLILLFIITSSGCEITSGENVISNSGTEASGSASVLAKLSGYTMPSEISAVPATGDGDTPAEAGSVVSLPAAVDGTDFSNARPRVYVEETLLKQFDNLENVLEAIEQTNYEDEIDTGPYKAMVAMNEENEGRNQKLLEPWVVQSESVREGGVNYLRVRVWIESRFETDGPVTKGEIKIYTPPTRNADESYSSYGKWEMHVKMDETGEDEYFVASCEPGADGVSVIKLYEKFSDMDKDSGLTLPSKVKAILYRSATEGYGKIYFPDFKSYYCPDCDKSAGVPHKTAAYAYNENYLAVQEGTGDSDSIVYSEPVFKDRKNMVRMTHRYGVFSTLTGEDVLRSRSFGFPFKYDANGFTRHAYYGSWQGRHEVWTNDGDSIPEGTAVERADTPPDQAAETYTVGKTYNGVLSKRTYAAAEPGDIQGIPVEIWMDQDFNLNYRPTDGGWYYCTQMDWAASPPVCAGTEYDFDTEIGLNTLIVEENNSRKKVHISGWDSFNSLDKTYVYEGASADNGNQAGFYEASEVMTDFGPVFRATVPRVLIDTMYVQQVWVNLSGSIFVEYQGETLGWVEKEVTYFDEMTWTPVFNESGNKPFSFPEGKELYVNMKGVSYVVQKIDGTLTVKTEIKTACTPQNAAAIIPAATTFYDQWNPDYYSTYEFITDPADPNFLMLVYASIGDDDLDQTGAPDGVAVGDIAQSSWGIEADISGVPVFFNWEYDSDGTMSRITYLMEGSSYKILDDPMRFKPITVQSLSGDQKTLLLQYDGWMSGLPDLHRELENSDFKMTDDIKNKIINLAAGTLLEEDSTQGLSFVLKPLEISLILAAADDPGDLDLTGAHDVDLNTVPIFREHGMGDMPVVSDVRYSEGHEIE